MPYYHRHSGFGVNFGGAHFLTCLFSYSFWDIPANKSTFQNLSRAAFTNYNLLIPDDLFLTRGIEGFRQSRLSGCVFINILAYRRSFPILHVMAMGRGGAGATFLAQRKVHSLAYFT